MDKPDHQIFANPSHFHLLSDIPVRLSVEVGSTSRRLSDIMALAKGDVVELDRQASEPLDIMVNGTLIAKGEVVTVDGRLGIRITELASGNGAAAGIERRGA
ncbi:MAG: flagellar motor switch protein FliN [Parasphingorhabdus sp.]|nr:flagellar motor switch protein FliN [Parasphingorhabdus sp.]